MGRIAVIVPVYNVAAYVGAAIESLTAQSFTDFEAVVVDDGSTDGSGDVARAAIGDDPRFRIITRENGGLSAARNTGLETVSAEFIAFLDSDDRYDPAYLETLLTAIETDGADWVACGVQYMRPDGPGATHSAIHGAGKIEGHETRRHPLTDWREVVRHFPSAWNKLYRRSLIAGLRFDEGTWFEDHAWFYRIACRTDHLLHVPRPLYLQTQGREGQITGDGGDRVFEQFPVLDTMRGIIEGSDKTGKAEGFERIATRLVYERSLQVTDPARRERYIKASTAYFAQNSLSYTPDWDPGIGRAWGLVMAGRMPVSVIVPVGPATEPQALADTRDSLAQQRLRDIEVIEVAEDAPPDENRNAGLARATGEYVVFLDVGDRLRPWALSVWVEAMIRHGADMGVSGFAMGLGQGKPHAGWHVPPEPAGDGPAEVEITPERALDLHAHPSAKIFRRAFLAEHGLRFPPGPLSSWDLTLRAALAAGSVLWLPTPGAAIATRSATRALWRAAPPFADLAAALAALPDAGNPRRLLARALWEKLNFAEFETVQAQNAFVEAARAYATAQGYATLDTPLDPYIGPRIRTLLGLPEAPPLP